MELYDIEERIVTLALEISVLMSKLVSAYVSSRGEAELTEFIRDVDRKYSYLKEILQAKGLLKR